MMPAPASLLVASFRFRVGLSQALRKSEKIGQNIIDTSFDFFERPL